MKKKINKSDDKVMPIDKTLSDLSSKLNDKQLHFVNEYINNGKNGTEAYLEAYDGVAYNSARTLASNLLKNEDIQNYIKYFRDKAVMAYQIDRNFIIEEYIELLNSAKFADESVDRANWIKALQNLTELLGLKEEETIQLNHTIDKINISIKRKNDNE